MSVYVHNKCWILSIALVLANFHTCMSYAQDERPVKFGPEEDRRKIPQAAMTRFNSKERDRVIFSDHIVFDDGDVHPVPKVKQVPEQYDNESLSVPLDLIHRLNNIDSFADLHDVIGNFTTELADRIGGFDEVDQFERKGIMPKPATCKPELVTVPLQNSDDKFLVYYPSCTRVERCGGCCSHELLSCQPTATETLYFQVIVTKYEGGNTLNYKGKETIPVEQHTKCKCDCKTKEKDCNSLQEYNKSECRCVCLNVDDEQKCSQENDTKLWDHNECLCSCRQTKECSTGFYFDQKTCKCIEVPILRQRINDDTVGTLYTGVDTDQPKYRLSPRSVGPWRKPEE